MIRVDNMSINEGALVDVPLDKLTADYTMGISSNPQLLDAVNFEVAEVPTATHVVSTEISELKPSSPDKGPSI